MSEPNKQELLQRITAIAAMERGKLSAYEFKERRALPVLTTNSSVGRTAKTTPGMFRPRKFPPYKRRWPVTVNTSN